MRPRRFRRGKRRRRMRVLRVGMGFNEAPAIPPGKTSPMAARRVAERMLQ